MNCECELNIMTFLNINNFDQIKVNQEVIRRLTKLNQTVQSIQNKPNLVTRNCSKCLPKLSTDEASNLYDWKIWNNAFYISNSTAFWLCWQWDEYHQISEAAACKDEEADPEEWSAHSWCHRWSAVLCCRVLVCWCAGVLVYWCHRYSNSTPAAPLLPFIFNLWHAVQLFELITSEAASATEAPPMNLCNALKWYIT